MQPRWEGEDLHNLFSTQDKAYHTALKRGIGGLYTNTAVMQYEPNIDKSLAVFVQRLTNVGTNKVPVDMSAWLQFWVIDAIGELNFSRPFGFLAAGRDLDNTCQYYHSMMLYVASVCLSDMEGHRLVLTMLVGPNPSFRKDCHAHLVAIEA